MTSDPNAFIKEIMLAFQQALWDMVTPTLRAITVRPSYPLIEARFIYEAVGEEEQEIASDLEAYVAAHFRDPVIVDFTAVALPPDEVRELKRDELWIYRRREEGGL